MVAVMMRASSGPPNSLMSAPAAKMRSPPVTTTAPGGSAVSASAWARSSPHEGARQGVDLRVVEGEDGHAVVASFESDQLGFVGHGDSLTAQAPTPRNSSSAADHGSRRRSRTSDSSSS